MHALAKHTAALRCPNSKRVSLLNTWAFMSHLRACPCVTDGVREWAQYEWDTWPEDNELRDWVWSPHDYRDCVLCKHGIVNWDMGNPAVHRARLTLCLDNVPRAAAMEGTRKRKEPPACSKAPVTKRARKTAAAVIAISDSSSEENTDTTPAMTVLSGDDVGDEWAMVVATDSDEQSMIIVDMAEEDDDDMSGPA